MREKVPSTMRSSRRSNPLSATAREVTGVSRPTSGALRSLPLLARVAELADAQDSGSSVLTDVGVQVPPRPPHGSFRSRREASILAPPPTRAGVGSSPADLLGGTWIRLRVRRVGHVAWCAPVKRPSDVHVPDENLTERLPRGHRAAGVRGRRPDAARRRSPRRSGPGSSPPRATCSAPTSRSGASWAKAKRRQARAEKLAARRGGARRHRHPLAAGQAGLHHAQRVRPRGHRRHRPSATDAPSRSTDDAAWASERALLRVQAALHRVHHFYDQLCPTCADVQLRQAHRDRRPARPGGAAHRRPGEDRLPGRDQAAAGRRRARSSPPASPATRRCATPPSPTSTEWGDRLEIYGLDLRHTPSVEAFCHHLDDHPRPARLHRQQRLPDRAPAARLLPPHDGARDRRRSPTMPAEAARAARRRTTGSAAPSCSRGPATCSSRAAGGWPATRPAELSQAALLPEEHEPPGPPVPRGPARPGPPAGRPARPELLAAHPGRGVVGRAARDAAGQRRGAVRAQRPAQAADAAHARARQAHRQRVGGGGPVLPALQDHPAPAHQHGQGRAQHDDPHLGRRLPRRRHPHEQRRHRLGERRGPGRDRRRARPPSTASTRRSTSSTAPPASSTRSSTASTPAPTCGASSSRTTAPPTGSARPRHDCADLRFCPIE